MQRFTFCFSGRKSPKRSKGNKKTNEALALGAVIVQGNAMTCPGKGEQSDLFWIQGNLETDRMYPRGVRTSLKSQLR
jgi:hypothetical protein